MASAGSLAEALEQLRQGCEELDLQSVEIGDEGAKELAAALKANSTLTTLDLRGACRGAALPTHRPRHRRTRMHACRRWGVRRASPERTPHARSPRPHRACARPACRRE